MPLPSLGGLTNAYKALPGSARRTLLHTGMGTAGGAVLGGLTAQEGQRLRGAATGGVIGGAAAGGASYLANRSAGAAIKGLRGDNAGLKSQNTGLSNRVSQMDSQLTGLGSQNASLMSSNVDLEGKYKALHDAHQQAQNEIAAAKAIVGNPTAQTSALTWGKQHGAPGEGAGAFRPSPVPVEPAKGVAPRVATQPAPYPAGAPTIQMPAGHTPTVQTPAFPPTLAQSGIFPKAAFTLTPGQGAALGGLGGAVFGGGVTALDPENDLQTIVRNAGLGGLVGTAGGYGLTLGGLNGGYSAGHHEGRMKGYNAGAEDLGVASRAAADALLRSLSRFD